MSSLAFKQARIAVFAGLLLGLTFSALQIVFDLQREVASVDDTYTRTLAAFEETAFQAAFGLDQELAERVVDGLLLQPAVIEATIIDSYGDTMSTKRRAPMDARFPSLVELTFGKSRQFQSNLVNVDNGFAVGVVTIVVDTSALASAFLQRSALVLGFGLLRNLVLAVLLTYLFYRLVTRPLRIMARAITGGAESLSTPRRNRADELGALATAYNQQSQRRAMTEQQLMAEERKHSTLFETSDISQWVIDLSPMEKQLRLYQQANVAQIDTYLAEHPQDLIELRDAIRVNSVNKATLDLFRTERSSPFVQTLGGILAENATQLLREMLIGLWSGRGNLQREMLLHRQDNSSFRAIVSMPLPSDTAQVQNVPVSIVNVSHLENARDDTSMHQEVFNAQDDGLCIVRLKDTSILMVNPALERMFQSSAQKLIGQPLLLLSVSTQKTEPNGARHLANIINADKGWRGLVNCQRRDGSTFVSRVQVSSLFHDQDGALAILSFRAEDADRP